MKSQNKVIHTSVRAQFLAGYHRSACILSTYKKNQKLVPGLRLHLTFDSTCITFNNEFILWHNFQPVQE